MTKATMVDGRALKSRSSCVSGMQGLIRPNSQPPVKLVICMETL